MTGALASVTFPALGTTVSVLVTDPRAIAAARQAVEHELAEMDAAASRFRPDSDLARLNGAGGRRVPVGPLLVTALTVAPKIPRGSSSGVSRISSASVASCAAQCAAVIIARSYSSSGQLAPAGLTKASFLIRP